MNGDVVITATGEELRSTGFEISINRMYDEELFEVSS